LFLRNSSGTRSGHLGNQVDVKRVKIPVPSPKKLLFAFFFQKIPGQLSCSLNRLRILKRGYKGRLKYELTSFTPNSAQATYQLACCLVNSAVLCHCSSKISHKKPSDQEANCQTILLNPWICRVHSWMYFKSWGQFAPTGFGIVPLKDPW